MVGEPFGPLEFRFSKYVIGLREELGKYLGQVGLLAMAKPPAIKFAHKTVRAGQGFRYAISIFWIGGNFQTKRKLKF